MGLLDAFKQYVKDALPGGLLNQEWTPERVKTAGSSLLDFIPVIGDVKSGYEGIQAARQGDWLGAGLGAAGALPFVPNMVGMVKGGSKAVDVLKAIPESSVVDAYQGLHRPPMKGSGAPLHDLTGGGQFYPDDVYSSNGLRYYGSGDDAIDREAWNLAMNVHNRPNAQVRMYRAVPHEKSSTEQLSILETQMKKFMARGKHPSDSGFADGSDWYSWASKEAERLRASPSAAELTPKINNGDWVTTSKAYAKQHGESALGGNYKVISQAIPARKLFTNGDSWAEFGYDESGKILPELLPYLIGGGLLGGYGVNQYGKE